MLDGLIGGIFGDKAKQTMNPEDRRNLRSAYITDIGNRLDTSGLGQTNAILGVYGKPAVGAAAPIRDVNADIQATNLAREKQMEDDRLKKKNELYIDQAMKRREETPQTLARILSAMSNLHRR